MIFNIERKLFKAKVDLGKVFDGIHGHINELDAFLFNNIDLIEKARIQIVKMVPSGDVGWSLIWIPFQLKSDLEKAESENQRLRAHIAGQR